jgi:hypothetical protein
MMGISRLNAMDITNTNHHSLSYSKFLKIKSFHLEFFLFSYVNEKFYFIVENHTKPPGPQAKREREGAALERDAHGGTTRSQEG